MQVGNIVQEKIYATRKKLKAFGGEAFSIDGEIDELESKEVCTTRVNISALWTLQEVDSYSADLDKMKQLGNALLKDLNNIRMDLINGELSKTNIAALKESLKNSKIKFQFPELQNALDDIELRAEVELAKLEMSEK
jgi:hypothetical protein